MSDFRQLLRIYHNEKFHCKKHKNTLFLPIIDDPYPGQPLPVNVTSIEIHNVNSTKSIVINTSISYYGKNGKKVRIKYESDNIEHIKITMDFLSGNSTAKEAINELCILENGPKATSGLYFDVPQSDFVNKFPLGRYLVFILGYSLEQDGRIRYISEALEKAVGSELGLEQQLLNLTIR